jgi:hypothetical protein
MRLEASCRVRARSLRVMHWADLADFFLQTSTRKATREPGTTAVTNTSMRRSAYVKSALLRHLD